MQTLSTAMAMGARRRPRGRSAQRQGQLRYGRRAVACCWQLGRQGSQVAAVATAWPFECGCIMVAAGAAAAVDGDEDLMGLVGGSVGGIDATAMS
jgi:hypothetical protein